MRVQELRDLLTQHLRRHGDHALFEPERDDPMHGGKQGAREQRNLDVVRLGEDPHERWVHQGESIHHHLKDVVGIRTVVLHSMLEQRAQQIGVLGEEVEIGFGSEVADLLSRSRLYRAFYGPAGLELTTARPNALPEMDYPVGVIAGNRFIDRVAGLFVLPRPNDGRVSVQSVMLSGMADHIVVMTSHTGLPRDRVAIEQTIAFLRNYRFS